jgi:hypothetical protein
MLDLRQEFPSLWHRFIAPANPLQPNVFEFEMSPDLFQMKDTNNKLKINSIWLLARCTDPAVYGVVLTLPGESTTFSMAEVDPYAGLHFSQKDVSNVSGMEVVAGTPVLWHLQMTRPLGGNLKPKEVEDLIMVLGYQLDFD